MVDRLRHVAAVGAVLALFAGSAAADVIHLKHGKVEGVVVERTTERLVVQTKAGKVTLDPAEVVRVERKTTPLSLYREMAADVEPDDAAGHYALGLWCAKNKLFRQAREEFEKTIELDPNHAGARKRLGYVHKDGEWMTRAEAKRADGLVLHDGKWITPEERDTIERRGAVLGWQRRIRQFLSRGPRDPERRAAALSAMLDKADDPAAEYAARSILHDLMMDAFDSKRDKADGLRLALVHALGEEPGTRDRKLLQRMAVQDRSPQVRAAALEVLADPKNVADTAFFVGLLDRFTGERYRVKGSAKQRMLARRALRRAAEALRTLDDPRAIPALAKALFVRFHIPGQGDDLPPMQMNLQAPQVAGGQVVTDSYGNQMVVPVRQQTNFGLDGFTGEDAEPVEDGFFFNEAAYSALREITGKDFGTDKRAWLAWWYRNKHNLVD
jgi:hypothetical protein